MSKPKIIIDPGHAPGNKNRGATGYFECVGMWKLANMLRDVLAVRGYEAALTRSENEDPALSARGKRAADAVLFISEHSNASNGSARGVEVFHSVDIPSDKKFAEALSKAVSGVMGNADRGAKTRESEKYAGEDYYGVIDAAQDAGCPHVLLIENGFHDNAEDEEFLKNDANLWAIAKAQADVIEKFVRPDEAAQNVETPQTADYTAISGKSVATAEQMAAYLTRVNPNISYSFLEVIPFYLSEGEAEGIRGDIAFAQSCLETGNFTFSNSAVTLEQSNFCGLGVTQNGMKGAGFATPQEGIRAQIQHLKAYANMKPLVNPVVDPRFNLVNRGCAPYLEWLGRKENPQGMGWATGAGYGEKIKRILAAIVDTKVPGAAKPAEVLPEGVEMADFLIDGIICNLPCVLIDDRNYVQIAALSAAGFAVGYDADRNMASIETPPRA